MKLHKKHVWNAAKIEVKPALIELREQKAMETASVLIFFGVPLLCFLWMMIRPNPPGNLQIDWVLVLGFGLGLIGLAILILYRPPRALRFYPLEGLAYQYRTFLFLRFPGRWHDLSQVKPSLRKSYVVVERQEGIGSVLLLIPMFFLGPLGILFALGVGRNSSRRATYVLSYEGQTGKPLALLIDRSVGQRLVDAYADKAADM